MPNDDSSMEETFAITEKYLKSFFREKSSLINNMLEGKKILEVGCGTGDLIQFLKLHDYEIMGTDYSDVYLNKARK